MTVQAGTVSHKAAFPSGAECNFAQCYLGNQLDEMQASWHVEKSRSKAMIHHLLLMQPWGHCRSKSKPYSPFTDLTCRWILLSVHYSCFVQNVFHLKLVLLYAFLQKGSESKVEVKEIQAWLLHTSARDKSEREKRHKGSDSSKVRPPLLTALLRHAQTPAAIQTWNKNTKLVPETTDVVTPIPFKKWASKCISGFKRAWRLMSDVKDFENRQRLVPIHLYNLIS